jgi:hypothetical protein
LGLGCSNHCCECCEQSGLENRHCSLVEGWMRWSRSCGASKNMSGATERRFLYSSMALQQLTALVRM